MSVGDSDIDGLWADRRADHGGDDEDTGGLDGDEEDGQDAYGPSHDNGGMEDETAQGSLSADAYMQMFQQRLQMHNPGGGQVQFTQEQLVTLSQVHAAIVGDRNPAKRSVSDEGGGWQRVGPKGTKGAKAKASSSGKVRCVGARSGPTGA